MKRLVEFQIAPGADEKVIVEVDEPVEESGEERAALVSWRKPTPADVDLESSVDRMAPAVELLLAKVRGLARRPEEATIEFGVKLTGHAGAVLASAGVEAHMVVTLTWRRDDTESDEPAEE